MQSVETANPKMSEFAFEKTLVADFEMTMNKVFGEKVEVA